MDSNTLERLESFLGVDASQVKISNRQKDAIKKLVYLPTERFIEMTKDIVNEINRREGKEIFRKGNMYEKLRMLNDEKFRNLVIDVFLVFKYRDNEGITTDLDNLILNLKSDYDEGFLERLKKLDFISKLVEYNKYIRKTTTVNFKIAEEIDNVLSNEIKNSTGNLLESLFYPAIFLEKVDETNLKDDKEYLFHKGNIKFLLNDEGNPDLSAKLIRHEMMAILFLLVGTLPEKMHFFYSELNDLVNTLSDIKSEILGQNITDFKLISEKLSKDIDCIIKGTKEKELVDLMKMHYMMIGSLDNASSKEEGYRIILDFAKDFQKVLLTLK